MNPLKKVKELIYCIKMSYSILPGLERRVKCLEYTTRQAPLLEKILENTGGGGTSKEHLCDEEIIVSLTTYGKRLYDVAVTIESIMRGTVKPNRIILWLAEEMKNTDMPLTLQYQIKRGLEIEYCKDIRSYKKLIPCLKKYPEACIITIDDDVIYSYDVVEKLVNGHKRYPKNILANAVDRMVLDENGKPTSCLTWKRYDPGDESPLNAFVGCPGVLYPPHCFDEEIFNETVFMDICKSADDVWFHAMALKKGTLARKVPTHNNNGHDFTSNTFVQDDALWRTNLDPNDCLNDKQLKAVFTKYDLYKLLT